MSPRSGLLQGAEAYLRSFATRRGIDPVTATEVRAAIQEWDEQRSGAGSPADLLQAPG
ncbi:hypothetical protein [Streptomyces cyaneofuscatus]|uniref:hypothetical protein n=1 Tax=Streptomyces cyaneofuscatus TaxID=66883 RepID=UPI00339F9741